MKRDNHDQDSIEELEVKVAFLEDAVSSLSDEFYQQQKELESLKKQLALFSSKMTDQDNENQSSNAEDERPPHY
jgi:SlyX protein